MAVSPLSFHYRVHSYADLFTLFDQIFFIRGIYVREIRQAFEELVAKAPELTRELMSVFARGGRSFQIIETYHRENSFSCSENAIFLNFPLIQSMLLFVQDGIQLRLEHPPLSIVLAHELIHAYHHTKRDVLHFFPQGVNPYLFSLRAEEYQTIEGMPVSENLFRAALGLPRRVGHLCSDSREPFAVQEMKRQEVAILITI